MYDIIFTKIISKWYVKVIHYYRYDNIHVLDYMY